MANVSFCCERWNGFEVRDGDGERCGRGDAHGGRGRVGLGTKRGDDLGQWLPIEDDTPNEFPGARDGRGGEAARMPDGKGREREAVSTPPWLPSRVVKGEELVEAHVARVVGLCVLRPAFVAAGRGHRKLLLHARIGTTWDSAAGAPITGTGVTPVFRRVGTKRRLKNPSTIPASSTGTPSASSSHAGGRRADAAGGGRSVGAVAGADGVARRQPTRVSRIMPLASEP